jgi:hypothetical protein
MLDLLFSLPQRREIRRHAVYLPCEAVRESGFRRIGGRILDLSDDGCYVATDTIDLDLGEEVFLAFKAPRTSQWMDARGVVRRRSRGARRDDLPKGLGLELIDMSPVERAILSASLVRLPPPIPTRRHVPDYAAFVMQIAAL